jgi:predicted Zn-dependent protease
MAASTTRVEAFEAMRLYLTGEHTAALARAKELARANPDSALVLNVLGTLHVHASSAAWDGRALGDEEAASSHRRDAVEAFSAAARIAPNCVMTAVCHAQALAAEQRFAEAIPEVARIIGKPVDEIDDPKLHNVMYDMESISSCSDRKIHARHSERR